MKIRFLMICAIAVGLSLFVSIFILSENFFEISPRTNFTDDREDLEKVVISNTACAKYWRSELYEMSNNKTYDYRNDPIFQECYKALDSIIWNSNIASEYSVDENIEFQVTVTMQNPPCREFIAKIHSFDYSEIIWEEQGKPECKSTKLMKKFPIDNPLSLEAGTYNITVELVGGGYGMFTNKIVVSSNNVED